MTLTKSLLLGSAAGLLAVSGASAADLPSRSKGPAVEYVRICDTYGAGYFYIPGTDTCLKISGYARADYAVRNVTNQWGSRGAIAGPGTSNALGGNVDETNGGTGILPGTSGAARHSTGFSGLGGLELDARSQTAWGTLRGFIRYEIFSGNGLLQSTLAGTGGVANPVGALDKAFVQFAGITAGRAQSFFTFYGDAYPLDISRGEDSTTTLLAYTASFGGGFSATVSIEDPVVRRGGIGALQLGDDTPIAIDPTFRTAVYGGSKLPDLVAQLRVDQSWGKAQLSGAVHQINTVATSAVGDAKATGTGWAVQAGIAINLPSLAAGDEVYLQGGYANGAKSYLGLGNLGDRTNAPLRNDVDAVAVAVPGAAGAYRLEKGHGWNVQAGLKHFWAPNVKQYLYASYTTWNYGANARSQTWDNSGYGNGKELMIGSGIVWTPVKNLDLTFDVSYQHLSQNVNVGVLGDDPLIGLAGGIAVPIKKNGSSFTGRLRIQRAF